MTNSGETNFTNATQQRGNNSPFQGLQSIDEVLNIISLCLYIIIFILSVLGNSAIICIVLKNKTMRTKANVLIVNMAISDLLVTVFQLPRRIDVIVSSPEWKIDGLVGDILCRVLPFVREMSCAVSSFSLVGIAIDRFFAIVLPLAAKPVFLNLTFMIPVIWGISAVSNSPILYYTKVMFLKLLNGIRCFNTLNEQQRPFFDTFRFLAFIAIPLIVLTILYALIVARMISRDIPGSHNEETANNSRRKQNRNVLRLAVAIVVSFALCWLPFYIGTLLSTFVWVNGPPIEYWKTIHILNRIFENFTYASLAINPYLCLLFSSNFRRSGKNTFGGLTSSARNALTRITTTRNPSNGRLQSASNIDFAPMNRIMTRHPSDARMVSVSNIEISLDTLNANQSAAINRVGSAESEVVKTANEDNTGDEARHRTKNSKAHINQGFGTE